MAAPAPGAYISLKQLVFSWLAERGKNVHGFAYIRAMRLAARAVQEMSYMRLPIIKQGIITKADGAAGWAIPAGYTALVSIGYTNGNGVWTPIGMAQGLAPFPASIGGGLVLASTSVSFDPAGFGSGFDTSSNNPVAQQPPVNYDGVVVEPSTGMIYAGAQYGNQLYIRYTAVGTADTMTEIPVMAQMAIDCWMDWHNAETKRSSSAGDIERLRISFVGEQQELLRRIDPLDIIAIRRAVLKIPRWTYDYGLFNTAYTAPSTGGGGVTPTPTPTPTPTGWIEKTYHIGFDGFLAGGSLTDPLLVGKQVKQIMILDATIIQMTYSGVTFDPATGTINFSAIGGLFTGSYLTIEYRTP